MPRRAKSAAPDKPAAKRGAPAKAARKYKPTFGDLKSQEMLQRADLLAKRADFLRKSEDLELEDLSFWYENKSAYARKKQPTYVYTPELGAKLCSYIARGYSIANLTSPTLSPLRSEYRPSSSMVYRWLQDDPEFAKAVQFARKICADRMAAEIVEIADSAHAMVPVHVRDQETGALLYNEDGSPVIGKALRVLDADVIQLNKLRIDARKWYTSKIAPREYGDRVTQEHTSPTDAPVMVGRASDLRNLSDADLAQLETLMKKALPGAS